MTLVEKINKARQALMELGLTNNQIAKDILGVHPVTLSCLCTGTRVARDAVIIRYILVLEHELQKRHRGKKKR